MSYQEKKTITSIITGILILASYCFYAFGKQPVDSASGDVKFWVGTMLVFIGVGIAAAIVIQIVFHILMSVSIAIRKKFNNENCDDKEIEKSIELEMVEDERDKLIELKSMKAGYVIVGFGFVSSLLLLMFDYSMAVFLNVLFITFGVASLVEGAIKIYYYRTR